MQIDFINETPETLAEMERIAYISGDTRTADLLAAVGEAAAAIDAAEDVETLEQWEAVNGPASEYRDFFGLCFDQLNDHYPAPSITSDYDRWVILDAIQFGESARNLLQRIADDGGNFADEARAMLVGDN